MKRSKQTKLSALSQAAYARHRGCDPRDVRRALTSGLIHRDRHGKIDSVGADAEWAAGTNPASTSRPGTKGNPGLKPVSADAIEPARNIFRSAGERSPTAR